ncbi:MAG: ATP-binding protein [Roseibium sp.]
MTDTSPPTDDAVKNKTEISALLRLGEVRWILFAALCMAVVLIVFYGVPVSVAVVGFFTLVLAAVWGARRPVSPRVKLKAGRELRRMWPGTGMKLTVDALPDPCFVADGRGITRYVNTQAMSVYQGVKPGDPLSLSLRIPSLLEAFDRVTNTGNSERISWTEKVPTELWFEANIGPIYMPGANGTETKQDVPDFILVVIQDQTENRRLERMRTDFVANASHELRTPLASLTGFVETLQGPAREDPVARDRFLSIMLEQSGRMRRLIDDILSLSRIELKAHVLPTSIVDLSDIVRHTADALAPLAKDMEMEIRLSLPSDPVGIAGDRDELIQVTENLVENALKYGSTGKAVDVGLEVVSEGDGRLQWQLSVKDYGEGIPIEHLPRLTERFYRVDVESSRALKGTGLGLAIVKHILTRHRARLDIDSEIGHGSTFKVTFQSAESAQLGS